MKDSHLKTQLTTYFPLQEEKFSMIEASIKSLTINKQYKETLNSFFKSWSQTNNSAMTVAGLSNRIVDEDLAVVGRVLHSKLFYTMATNITGDDSWLLNKYLSAEAITFKAWKDKNSLRNKDIMIGLLTTLVHEIYTHGEVEFIIPLFENWLAKESDLLVKKIDISLAWIRVHCGPTEKDHFFHAVDTVNSYVKAFEIDIKQYDLKQIIEDYLELKSSVMNVLNKEVLEAATF